MRRVQEDGRPSLGLIIQNGQRPLWFSCRMPSLPAHAVLHMPDSCHQHLWPDSASPAEPVFRRSPSTTSLEQRRSAGSSGLVDSPRPTTTTAHTGPKPAPALALTPRRLTGQAQPEPHDNKGHQKEKKRSHTPVAVRGPGHAGCLVNPQPTATQRSHGKARQRRHLAPLHCCTILLRGLVARSQ